MEDFNYSEADKSRMHYYLKEMREKLQKHPQSLCLINGLAYIEKVLGLPKTVTAIDPISVLKELSQ